MTAYEYGRLAREQGRYRVLCNPRDAAEEREWLRGWDDMDIELEPWRPTYVALCDELLERGVEHTKGKAYLFVRRQWPTDKTIDQLASEYR